MPNSFKNFLLQAGTGGHEISHSHSGRIFSAEAIDHSCFMSWRAHRLTDYFVDCPPREASDMSCISTGLRDMHLDSSLGPLVVGETWISQGLFHRQT